MHSLFIVVYSEGPCRAYFWCLTLVKASLVLFQNGNSNSHHIHSIQSQAAREPITLFQEHPPSENEQLTGPSTVSPGWRLQCDRAHWQHSQASGTLRPHMAVEGLGPRKHGRGRLLIFTPRSDEHEGHWTTHPLMLQECALVLITLPWWRIPL